MGMWIVWWRSGRRYKVAGNARFILNKFSIIWMLCSKSAPVASDFVCLHLYRNGAYPKVAHLWNIGYKW